MVKSIFYVSLVVIGLIIINKLIVIVNEYRRIKVIEEYRLSPLQYNFFLSTEKKIYMEILLPDFKFYGIIQKLRDQNNHDYIEIYDLCSKETKLYLHEPIEDIALLVSHPNVKFYKTEALEELKVRGYELDAKTRRSNSDSEKK